MSTPVSTKTSDLLKQNVLSPTRLSSTPTKINESSGILQRYFVIVKKISELFSKWDLAQKRGSSICQSIENIKSKALDNKEKGESLFPEELNVYCRKLETIVSIFDDIINYLKEAKRQFEALDKLCRVNEPIFRTWDSQKFLVFVNLILKNCQDEYAIKLKVMENIAHSQTKSDLVMHSSIWDYPRYAGDVDLMVMNLSYECC